MRLFDSDACARAYVFLRARVRLGLVSDLALVASSILRLCAVFSPPIIREGGTGGDGSAERVWGNRGEVSPGSFGGSTPETAGFKLVLPPLGGSGGVAQLGYLIQLCGKVRLA